MLKNLFGENWLEEEVKYNKFLTSYDYDTLKKAYNDTKEKYLDKYSIGKVISNINFGFWTNLCSKKYNSIIWTKKGVLKQSLLIIQIISNNKYMKFLKS